MNIQHEIIAFDPSIGSIAVRYFCNEFPQGYIYNIDLPFENGQYPSEQVVLGLIKEMAPVGQIQRVVAAQTATPPDFLAQHSVVFEPVMPQDTAPPTPV